MKINKRILCSIAAVGLALSPLAVLAAPANSMTFNNKTSSPTIYVEINQQISGQPISTSLTIPDALVQALCSSSGNTNPCDAIFSTAKMPSNTACSNSNSSCIGDATFTFKNGTPIAQNLTPYNNYSASGFTTGQPITNVTINQ